MIPRLGFPLALLPPPTIGTYVGLPFKDGGRDRAGIDCWGLIRLVYAELWGLDLPDLSGRYDDLSRHQDLAQLYWDHAAGWQGVEPSDLRLGDLLLLRIEGWASHVGMIVSRTKMLHAELREAATLEDFDSRLWRPRHHGFFRRAADQ